MHTFLIIKTFSKTKLINKPHFPSLVFFVADPPSYSGSDPEQKIYPKVDVQAHNPSPRLNQGQSIRTTRDWSWHNCLYSMLCHNLSAGLLSNLFFSSFSCIVRSLFQVWYTHLCSIEVRLSGTTSFRVSNCVRVAVQHCWEQELAKSISGTWHARTWRRKCLELLVSILLVRAWSLFRSIMWGAV